MSGMESSLTSGNVFTAEYLQALARNDEPAGAVEGELSGPWRAVEAKAGNWEVVRIWEGPAEGEKTVYTAPRVSATDEETALLFAATLPAVGRARLFRTVAAAEGGRLGVESEGRPVAVLAGLGEEAAAAAHVAACLARSPWALAMVLQAAGATVLREAGEILFRRMR